MGTLLRPDVVDVWRKDPSGGVGPTGNPVTMTPTKTYAAIAALVTRARATITDRLQFTAPTGEMVPQTDVCFIDGLLPPSFPGKNPGDTITVNGVSYVVAQNGRAAFVDVAPFDVVQRGTDRYLVLQVSEYSEVMPVLQLALHFGRAWQ